MCISNLDWEEIRTVLLNRSFFTTYFCCWFGELETLHFYGLCNNIQGEFLCYLFIYSLSSFVLLFLVHKVHIFSINIK